MKYQREFRNLEDLSDSDEEIHPNIDTRSYRKFIKEQRALRLQELKSKENLTFEEQKELEELEYKTLPVVKEAEESSFRVSKENESSAEDYSEDLCIMINLFTLEFFLDYFDRKNINLNVFEELVDLNTVEYIKCENDEIGLILCKIGLCTKWLKEFGKGILIKFSQRENKFDVIAQEHYEMLKKAILKLNSQ